MKKYIISLLIASIFIIGAPFLVQKASASYQFNTDNSLMCYGSTNTYVAAHNSVLKNCTSSMLGGLYHLCTCDETYPSLKLSGDYTYRDVGNKVLCTGNDQSSRVPSNVVLKNCGADPAHYGDLGLPGIADCRCEKWIYDVPTATPFVSTQTQQPITTTRPATTLVNTLTTLQQTPQTQLLDVLLKETPSTTPAAPATPYSAGGAYDPTTTIMFLYNSGIFTWEQAQTALASTRTSQPAVATGGASAPAANTSGANLTTSLNTRLSLGNTNYLYNTVFTKTATTYSGTVKGAEGNYKLTGTLSSGNRITEKWDRGDTYIINVKATLGSDGIASGTWKSSSGGSGTFYANRSTLLKYTITYNGNGNTGGSVPVNSNTYYSLSTTTVSNNTGSLVKTGYVFSGWNTLANGSGKYFATSSVLIFDPANVTLYAVWSNGTTPTPPSSTTYTITFNANGGAGTMPVQTLASGASATLRTNTFTRAGYTFAGWSTYVNGVPAYNDSSSYTMGSANVTLYASWTGTLVANMAGNWGQTLTSGGTNYTYNTTYKQSGSTFSGRAVIQDNSGFSYSVTGGIIGNGIKETWTSGSYKAYIVATMDVGGLVYRGTFTDNQGHSGTFIGKRISSTQPLVSQPTLYRVTYNSNYDTITPPPYDNGTYISGSSVTVVSTVPLRVGYTFAGWNTKADGTGTNRISGSTFTMGSTNVTLYAKWTLVSSASSQPSITVLSPNGGETLVVGNNIVVSWNSSGAESFHNIILKLLNSNGSVSSSVSVNPISGVQRSDALTSNGLAAGRYLVRACLSDNIDVCDSSDNYFTITSAVTPVATYTITFNPNGGTGTMSTQSIASGDYANLRNNNFTRAGYTFSGWSTHADGAYEYANSASYTMGSANVTLYASWTGVPAAVSTNMSGKWGQTLTSGGVGYSYNTTYTQSGATFSGKANSLDTPGFSYSVTGTVNGSTIKETWTDGSYKAYVTATMDTNGVSYKGTFKDSQGNSGSFVGKRISSSSATEISKSAAAISGLEALINLIKAFQ